MVKGSFGEAPWALNTIKILRFLSFAKTVFDQPVSQWSTIYLCPFDQSKLFLLLSLLLFHYFKCNYTCIALSLPYGCRFWFSVWFFPLMIALSWACDQKVAGSNPNWPEKCEWGKWLNIAVPTTSMAEVPLSKSHSPSVLPVCRSSWQPTAQGWCVSHHCVLTVLYVYMG